ncbi:hypothetical protein B0J11DRAFT_191567 [Dendryphion nanum]|uniref:Uncharacterized protein n=1 Tax=Dendryphion nanum TaxID=256645 RepID=A0A9P9D3S1_9PLEO|nr:hypothetical protein B0J11DRAFT_191567 [Dendryphion nanum]
MLVYRDKEGSVGSLAFAYSKFYKFLSLTDNLPKSLWRSKASFTPALVLHMHIHVTIMGIFRPFVPPNKQHGFRSYISDAGGPESIFSASTHQLKGLLFEYAHRCSPTHYNLVIFAAVIYAVNATLSDPLDQDRRAYILFYVQMGFRANYRGLSDTIQAIIALAHDKGVVSSAEATQFARHVGDVGKSGWVVDVELAASDAVAANVDSLGEKFEEITLLTSSRRVGII